MHAPARGAPKVGVGGGGGRGGSTFIPLPNSSLMAAVARGTPMNASMPRNHDTGPTHLFEQTPDQQGSRSFVSFMRRKSARKVLELNFVRSVASPEHFF